ncbi:MAG TPA: AbrB/MazE/SpoVT family DNA-binding domain-containing protein [Rhodothermales bacterium]|nr:AbrB/MazE/SpoVT family DNA-binding domain-containing protein [Rhodothermales bacterium]
MTITLDKFGRLLIPKPVRDRLGLKPGDELVLDVREGGDGAPSLELRPESAEPPLRYEGNLLVHTGRLPDTFDPDAFARQQREERERKLMGLGE